MTPPPTERLAKKTKATKATKASSSSSKAPVTRSKNSRFSAKARRSSDTTDEGETIIEGKIRKAARKVIEGVVGDRDANYDDIIESERNTD